MKPSDNILYFNNDIDIRLCPKNGSSSLREAWMSSYFGGQKSYGHGPSSKDRHTLVMQNQDIWDQPFRKGSYRIAVKRDPVERFISTVLYLAESTKHPNYFKLKKSYTDLTSVNLDNIESIIEAFENQILRDEHFFTQSYFMGHPNDYDKVYYLTELPQLLLWLEKKVFKFQTTTLWFEKLKYSIADISHKNPVPFRHLWENKAKYTDQRVQLTIEQTKRIVKLYAKDYANGWY